jgi:hypothetical protein
MRVLSGELGRRLLLFMRSQFSSCTYIKIFLVSSRLVVIIIIAVAWINRDRFCIPHGRKLEVWESVKWWHQGEGPCSPKYFS